MAQGRFVELGRNVYRWLGSGIYFFEENFELSQRWATMRATKEGREPAIVRAEIDLSRCLDLTRAPFQTIVRNAHRLKEDEWKNDPKNRPEQRPLELYKGVVRQGYHGDWENYGKNELDYAVIEYAIDLAKDQEGLILDTVRGAFIELGPLYDCSWLFEGAHVAIAVRKPYVARLRNIKAIEFD